MAGVVANALGAACNISVIDKNVRRMSFIIWG